MKLKPIYFIPFYGFVKYYKEYFAAQQRDTKDAIQASWIQFYHVFLTVLLLLYTISYFKFN